MLLGYKLLGKMQMVTLKTRRFLLPFFFSVFGGFVTAHLHRLPEISNVKIAR